MSAPLWQISSWIEQLKHLPHKAPADVTGQHLDRIILGYNHFVSLPFHWKKLQHVLPTDGGVIAQEEQFVQTNANLQPAKESDVLILDCLSAAGHMSNENSCSQIVWT